ncbi:MAG: hypothetical protein IJJ26_00325 [Victivallales bacterium]|nr:hypothetical protein [Victivallales bacterium]
MLTRLQPNQVQPGLELRIAEAGFPAPFASTLEYNPPARGTWNIVHTGMLLPEAHQIYACAQGCLRGVILTAAEMKAMDRMSWISVKEEDLFNGTMEQNVVSGVSHILERLPRMPRAVLLYVSCLHLFTGCDMEVMLNQLRERFPDIDFTDCYMTPTMRKTIAPDPQMRRQLYSLLRPLPLDEQFVNLIGNDLPTRPSCELFTILHQAGKTIRDITLCHSYDDYLAMASSAWNLTFLPVAIPAGEELQERLGQKHLHLPLVYTIEQIQEAYRTLAQGLQINLPDLTPLTETATRRLREVAKLLKGLPVAIDASAAPRPLNLARCLLEHGFRVNTLYADDFPSCEETDFRWLQGNHPELLLRPVGNPSMRFAARGMHEPILAIGQKAAYFEQTPHFVNMTAAGSGLFGFDGLLGLADLLEDAFLHEKDIERVISHKGFGCVSCLGGCLG